MKILKILLAAMSITLLISSGRLLAASAEYQPITSIFHDLLIVKLAPELLTDEWMLKATTDRIRHDQQLLTAVRGAEARLASAHEKQKALWREQISKNREKMFFQPSQIEGRGADFAARALWREYKTAIIKAASKTPTKFAAQYNLKGPKYNFEKGHLYGESGWPPNDYLAHPFVFSGYLKEPPKYPNNDVPYFVYQMGFFQSARTGTGRSIFTSNNSHPRNEIPERIWATHPFPPDWRKGRGKGGIAIPYKLQLPPIPMSAAKAENILTQPRYTREQLQEMQKNGVYSSPHMIIRIEGEITGIRPATKNQKMLKIADIHRIELIGHRGEVLKTFGTDVLPGVKDFWRDQQAAQASAQQAQAQKRQAAATALATKKQQQKSDHQRQVLGYVTNCEKRKLDWHKADCRQHHICKWEDYFGAGECDKAKKAYVAARAAADQQRKDAMQAKRKAAQQ